MRLRRRGAGSSPADHRVTLLTRAGCHLCQDAEDTVTAMAVELGFVLEVTDIDADRQLADEYTDRVPVVLIDGREHGYWRVEPDRLRAALHR